MNYKDAFDVLEINAYEVSYNDLTLEYLKKKYHKLAGPRKFSNCTIMRII